MFLMHQRKVPRCKEWVPLATHQLRLRNLIQVLAFGVKRDRSKDTVSSEDPEEEKETSKKPSYYYTLHLTTMSAPFYTSEKLENDNLKWKEIEATSWKEEVNGSADALVIRLWCHNPCSSDDQIVGVWGIYFSGLTYLGQHLGSNISLKPNSIVLFMPGGYFTDPNSLESIQKIRFISISINQMDVRQSYTVDLLTRMHRLQQEIRKQSTTVESLKHKISMGDIFRNENRGKTVLRRLLAKNKPKVNHQDLMKVKEKIELAKYRVQILTEEKCIASCRLKRLGEKIESKSDANQMTESRIMENYRLLMREVQSQREWKKGHIERREGHLHAKAMLSFRTKQLVSELDWIYPIEEKSTDKYTICGVHLPDSEDFIGRDEIQISVALGFVTHVIQMTSIFLQVPLRYPVIHFGSRSRIADQIADKIPDSEREFPLYLRGKEKLQFNYAVYLLNKNIAQLRWLCGLPTQDLRNTLANLSTLVKTKTIAGGGLDHNCRSLSSSTADVCSSSLSMSSPRESSGFSKNFRIHRFSESVVVDDFKSKKDSASSSRHVPGHRISKSVGSAKDLMTDTSSATAKQSPSIRQLKSNSNKAVDALRNSTSYSLDKGLNEFEEITSNAEQGDVNRMGSEPSLPTLNGVQIFTKTTQAEAKSEFLKSWEAEKQMAALSDEDSSCLNCDDKKLGTDSTRSVDPEPVENLKENQSTDFRNSSSSCDENPSDSIKCDKKKEGDVERNLFSSDSLLESVVSRSEALASQTTSFNRCRTRFKSILENPN